MTDSPPVLRTSARLADGREIIFFDDDPRRLAAGTPRQIHDERPLGPREPPPGGSANIRIDPLTGDPVAIAAHRMNRTFLPPADQDPLAPTVPGGFPTEVPQDDYDVVVFENRFPSLQGPLEVLTDEPLRHETTPAGRCEVVCFTPDTEGSFASLPLRRVRTVIEAWTDRTRELSALEAVRQVFVFENRGEEIGVTLHHPHGQIYGYSYLPPYTRQVQHAAHDWRRRTGGDLLADVLHRELADEVRVIARGEHFTAFVPYAAKWPVEFQLVPHRAARDFTELTDAEKAELAVMTRDLLGRLDRFFEGPEQLPYISGWHQVPVGGGEDISRMWWHVFTLLRAPGKMKYLAGSESAMGAWINDTTPERIAARLREVAP